MKFVTSFLLIMSCIVPQHLKSISSCEENCFAQQKICSSSNSYNPCQEELAECRLSCNNYTSEDLNF